MTTRNVEALRQREFDLVILGGGITGAGVALDAALRGWRVALIDKGDFASGTSSVSSKLVHGGLRYLEYAQFSLVREALHERALLLRNAPHLVKPLPFLLPFYRGQRRPGWQWRLGLTLYDLLAGRANIARSRPCRADSLRAFDSSLQRDGLLGGAIYCDALMDDARLCLAVLQTAARHGAVLANYVEAIGFEKHDGLIAGVWAQDRLGGSPFLVRGRIVLNATGPWVDAVARLAGAEGGPYLRPSKGVHLIAPERRHRCAYLLLHPADGRVFFVIPWEGKTLLGTTDTDAETDPGKLAVHAEEITYLLDAYNHYFDPGLRSDEIMGTFAGLRPLVRSQPGNPSARPREFRLIPSRTGLVTAVGGKYTTYRSMAATIVDYLGQRLGRRQPSRTATLPLVGTPAQPWSSYFEASVTEMRRLWPAAGESIPHLVNRYGDRAQDVLQVIAQTPDGFERIHPEEPDLLGEQAYQRAEEMALFPDDLFLRRSRIGMYRPQIAPPLVPIDAIRPAHRDMSLRP